MRCWYTRWKLSSALDDGGDAALEALARHGHASRCTRCQAHARSLAALHARLAGGAGELNVPAPAPLAPARPARPARWPVLAGGAVAAAAGLVLVLRAGDPEPAVPPADPIAMASPRGSGSAAGSLQQTAARVAHAAATASTSLDAELQALIDDGSRGVSAVLTSSGLRELP